MSDFTIREASYSELPRIAQVLTRAFWDDGMFGDVMHPHRKAHPEGMARWWLRRARVDYWDYTWKWMVAVARDDQGGAGEEEIVGIAQWARLGEGGKKMRCYWLDPRNLLKPISGIAMKAHALVWPNRACDPEKEGLIELGAPFIKSAWTGDRAECWYLEFLGVDPASQGKGAGKLLVQWGLEQAQKEGVCASVISAEGKDGFYQKCGFDVVDGHAGMGEGNPLADVPGGNIHWRMPKVI